MEFIKKVGFDYSPENKSKMLKFFFDYVTQKQPNITILQSYECVNGIYYFVSMDIDLPVDTKQPFSMMYADPSSKRKIIVLYPKLSPFSEWFILICMTCCWIFLAFFSIYILWTNNPHFFPKSL